MKKSELAKSLYNILNIINDYYIDGIKKNIENIDFSFMDSIISEEINKNKISKEENNIINIKNNENITELPEINLKKRELISLSEKILKCEKCELSKNSINRVLGIGEIPCNILIISDYITEEEEKKGLPLIGNVGFFFEKWLTSIKIKKSEIFITTLTKCRPKDLIPTRNQIESCRFYLDKQIDILKPKIILVLGEITLSSLQKKYLSLEQNHGKIFYYKDIPYISTFHPKDVLQYQNLKKDVWEDLKKFREHYDNLLKIC